MIKVSLESILYGARTLQTPNWTDTNSKYILELSHVSPTSFFRDPQPTTCRKTNHSLSVTPGQTSFEEFLQSFPSCEFWRTCVQCCQKWCKVWKIMFQILHIISIYYSRFWWLSPKIWNNILIYDDIFWYYCRSRKMFTNGIWIAKIGCDTAENEPPKGPKTGFNFSQPLFCCLILVLILLSTPCEEVRGWSSWWRSWLRSRHAFGTRMVAVECPTFDIAFFFSIADLV